MLFRGTFLVSFHVSSFWCGQWPVSMTLQNAQMRRGIDGHAQPPGRAYSANEWRRQATRSHWVCPSCSTLSFLAFEGKEVGKLERRRDFSLASSKLAFAKRVTLSANGNPVVYNCMLNVKRWKCCKSQSPCLLSWCVLFRALLKRKMEFRMGKRKSWQYWYSKTHMNTTWQ